MKQFKSFGLVVVTLLFSVTMAFAAKPNIHILATGGTIAGTGSSATQQDKLPSAHYSMPCRKLRISPT